MNLDGRRLSEDERMRLLREEEDALGIQPLEYVSNGIISHRLSLHQQPARELSPSATPAPPPPGATAAQEVTAADTHHDGRSLEAMDGAVLT